MSIFNNKKFSGPFQIIHTEGHATNLWLRITETANIDKVKVKMR